MENQGEYRNRDRRIPYRADGKFVGFGPDIAATFNVEPARLIQAMREFSEEQEPDLAEPAGEVPASQERRQVRIERHGMLHNVNGRLNACGYMNEPLLRYDRSRVKVGRLRIKEWNRYLISDDEYALWLTVANFGYLGAVSARVTNLVHPSSRTVSILLPMPGRRLSLPPSCLGGQIAFKNHRGRFICQGSEEGFRIMANYDEFLDGETLAVDALLDCRPPELFANVSQWPEDPRTFHYQLAIPMMRASGSFKVGSRVHGFSPTRSFGLYGWNRAVLPYETQRIWAVAQGWQDGQGGTACDTHLAGLLLADGQDNRAATPNAFFLDGKIYKLGDISFDIPNGADREGGKTLADRYHFLHAWRIGDSKGQVSLTFVPVTEGIDYQNAAAIFFESHQVFGAFSGTVRIEGREFFVNQLPGCAAIEHLRG
ncbi:MAG: DUF2804 domain-containing protein [Eggerthellaceae bacterium]